MASGESWGRWPRYQHRIIPLKNRFEPLPDVWPMLPYGNGRSYGDVCLNDRGALLSTRTLDRLISFDEPTGVLECEAGVMLSEIIALFLPRGWFPPVTPGTSFVTLGGAIANDVHGKNHHRAGTIGHHVLDFELLRSDGQVLQCSADTHPEWFRATIGGLGLTGLIRKVRLRLRPVSGPWIDGDSQRFSNLNEFFELADASDSDYEYTVAWVDCAARNGKLGRGVFMRGNHQPRLPASIDAAGGSAAVNERSLHLPLTPPFSPIRGSVVRAFNSFYFHRPAAQQSQKRWHFLQFHYPLDRILGWNRIYGPHGFYQYQCVVPEAAARANLSEMLDVIARSGQGSFLSVLKKFGAMPSIGLLSFPRPGVTLALDFPNRGASTLRLLESLDAITRRAGGAVYPAKDARMSPSSFRQYFPAWEQFQGYIDPKFSSSFWRRVTANGG